MYSKDSLQPLTLRHGDRDVHGGDGFRGGDDRGRDDACAGGGDE